MGEKVRMASKGPWKPLDIHTGLPLIKPNNTVIAVVSGMKGVAEGNYKVVAMLSADYSNCRGVRDDWSMFPDHHESWSNRDLICAAPDLLSACKAWLDYFHELRDHEDPLDRMAKIRDSFHAKRIEQTRLAVVKAEGTNQ